MLPYYRPLSDLEKAFVEALEEMPVIDGHEHLPLESERIRQKVDAFTLFSHYCQWDLWSAGLHWDLRGPILWGDRDLDWKWKEFAPYYGQMKHTCYARAAHIALEHFYGEKELTADNVAAVTERMQQNNTPGLYDRVLRKECKIETTLNCDSPLNERQGGLITPLARHPGDVWDWETLSKGFAGPNGEPPQSFDDVLDACKRRAETAKALGLPAVKFMPLYYRGYTLEEAKECFAQMKANPQKRFPRTNPVTEYAFRKAMEYTHEAGLVCSVHTGYWNDYKELSPENLVPIIRENWDMKIDVFHLGYPYVREAIMLGKVWPNVRLNLCWTYLISQKFAMEALDELLEMVPVNKIFAFGGDYYVVEKVFGHLVMARETIAKVLAKKVSEGVFSFDRGLEIARMMLYSNIKAFYGL